MFAEGLRMQYFSFLSVWPLCLKFTYHCSRDQIQWVRWVAPCAQHAWPGPSSQGKLSYHSKSRNQEHIFISTEIFKGKKITSSWDFDLHCISDIIAIENKARLGLQRIHFWFGFLRSFLKWRPFMLPNWFHVNMLSKVQVRKKWCHISKAF